MKGEHIVALQQRVKAEIVETPLIQRLGLKDGDLYGAALAATNALQAGEVERALNSFAHLLLLDPTNPEFHAGFAEAALAMNEHAMALQSASVVVASRPNSPDGYFLSARACIGLGEPALALEDLAETEIWAQKAGKPGLVEAARKLRALIGEVRPAAT